jgi:hypothetical protein
MALRFGKLNDVLDSAFGNITVETVLWFGSWRCRILMVCSIGSSAMGVDERIGR